MESYISTPLSFHIPESSFKNAEMIFLDNFNMESSPEIQHVLSSLDQLELSPKETLVDKVIHYGRNYSHTQEYQ